MVKNEQSAFSDFSKFPIIERSLWDKWVDNTAIQSVLISRGCPNSCSFCANHVLRRKNSGQYVEFRNVDDIMKEIITIRKKYPEVHTVFLETETFSIDLKYTYRLLDKLKKYNGKLKNKLKVYTNLLFNNSVKNDMKNFAVKLKEANLVQICMGLESGSQRIRKDILHRPHYTNDDFITFCRYMQKQGVFVALNVMVGLPTETAEDLDMTIAVVDEISPAIVMPTIFTSYPGTDIYDLMLKNKIIKNSKFITGWDERRKARLGSDKMTKKVIQEKFQYLLDKYENVDKRRIQTAKLLRANKNN
ncbi:hypothetical protein MASR1M68_13090 [Elusimicrobiota bacterium]